MTTEDEQLTRIGDDRKRREREADNRAAPLSQKAWEQKLREWNGNPGPDGKPDTNRWPYGFGIPTPDDPEQPTMPPTTTTTTRLQERDFSADERRELAAKGHALPDGSFPILDADSLQDAIDLAGKAHNPYEARRHIKKRAQQLGLTAKIPDTWQEDDHTPADGTRLSEQLEQLEAHVLEADGATGHVIDVTLLRGGTSRNGNEYPTDTLLRSVPLFEGVSAYADHSEDVNPLQRSIRDIVGYYKNTRLEQHNGTPRIRAQLHLVPGTDWLFNIIRESQSHPNLCGLSIDALGELADGTKHVTEIKRVFSVDVVARPAAGGSFDRILASEANSPTRKDNAMPPDAATSPTAKPDEKTNPAHPAGQTTTSTPVKEQETKPDPNVSRETSPPKPADKPSNSPASIASLVEQQNLELKAARDELARVNGILNPGAVPNADPNTRVDRLVEELKRDRDLTKSAATLDKKLGEAKLPEPVDAKIRRAFDGKIFEAELLENVIKDERDTLAALSGSGQIFGMGYEKSVSVGMNEYEQLQTAFDRLFDLDESEAQKQVPGFTGIREAFYIATGTDIMNTGMADRPLRENYAAGLRDYTRRGRLTEQEAILREADVTTASFSALLGTSMNKRLLKDYQAWPSEWQKFTSIVAVKDFKLQTRVRLGAFGSLSTVAEDAAYTTLTVADTSATYTPTKRGNLVQVTRETIINDDLYAIKQIPQKLAAAAAFTLAEFVYNLMAPSFGNIYDAHPLFDSVNHLNTGVIAANLGTAGSGTALSSAALQTAIIKMRKQTNLASKPIGLKPRYILTVPDLEFTAMTLLRSAGLPGGNNNDINPMMGYAEPIISPQMNALTAGPTSTTVWIAVADPRVIDTLEVGFIGGQANPVLLIQDMPLYGLNFTQDTISYKVRHEYGGAVVDYRGFYLGNN